jgi:hypothetical protein
MLVSRCVYVRTREIYWSPDSRRLCDNRDAPPVAGLRPYCAGAELPVPCMKARISSRVRRPSLFASIALKMRS